MLKLFWLIGNYLKIKRGKMTTYQKIQRVLIALIVIFTIIVIGLTIGVVVNNTYLSDYPTWESCRKALFAFTAFDSASILGLIIVIIFKDNIDTTKQNKK